MAWLFNFFLGPKIKIGLINLSGTNYSENYKIEFLNG